MKSLTQLQSFTDYCVEHQDERFWQALRNWSGYQFIYGSTNQMFDNMIDTFSLEGKRHDDKES